MARRWIWISLTLLLACDPPPAEPDAATPDASIADASSPEPDAGDLDAAVTVPDAGPTDAGLPDAGPPYEPYFFDDFESYADGESLARNPFGSAGRTTASAEQAARGSQSARMEIRRGDGGGFGRWGGILPLRPRLVAGQEVWVRLDVYWPSSFEFSATPWMKFIRVHTRTETGENGGYNDLYVDEADQRRSVLRTIKEGHDRWEVYGGDPIPRDTWERYEMYLFLDDASVDEGGEGRVRIWRDGELIFDRTDVPTLPPNGDADYVYLFTYWNNERPPDNHCYVDDLVIATSDNPPPNVDPAGNVYLGDWTP